MEKILTVEKDLHNEALRVSEQRKRIKAYLQAHGACYDKFTVTENDTYLGYVTETAIKNYLQKKYGSRICITRWGEEFDLDRINNAVLHNDPAEKEYVKAYFYDKYDLKIKDVATGKTILVDVKTAETSKYPAGSWEFMYPVVQNQRGGKDCVILCYYYKQGDEKNVLLVGFITEEEIATKKIYPKGTRTPHYTYNQIDNYETILSDYKDLGKMLEHYFGFPRE